VAANERHLHWRKRPEDLPGRVLNVAAITPAATPIEATPEPTSAVLTHSQVQITEKPPHPASHQADEVENLVFVACRNQLP
jgi:hypothetical protein